MPETTRQSQLEDGSLTNSVSVEKRARTADIASTIAKGKSTASVEALDVNPWYFSDEFTDSYREAFTSKTLKDKTFSIKQPVGDGEGLIVPTPFHTGKLRNTFPKEFLHGLKGELMELNWHERLNDLYWFHQTDDLALNGKQHIKALRDYLSGEEFVGFMEKITGTQLARGYLDIAAQRYKKGNHLLCHDDD
ncbi:putative component of NuA3 histone acetyltransferase complex, partial [Kickxella alabastrina]